MVARMVRAAQLLRANAKAVALTRIITSAASWYRKSRRHAMKISLFFPSRRLGATRPRLDWARLLNVCYAKLGWATLDWAWLDLTRLD